MKVGVPFYLSLNTPLVNYELALLTVIPNCGELCHSGLIACNFAPLGQRMAESGKDSKTQFMVASGSSTTLLCGMS